MGGLGGVLVVVVFFLDVVVFALGEVFSFFGPRFWVREAGKVVVVGEGEYRFGARRVRVPLMMRDEGAIMVGVLWGWFRDRRVRG